MGRGHIRAHVAGFAQVFDAAPGLPGIDLVQAHAAQAVFGRAQHLKAGGRVSGLEQARGLGVFRQAFGLQQTGHQQEYGRAGELAGFGKIGEGGRGKAGRVHARTAGSKHAGARAQNARLAEHADVVLILKKYAFRAGKRRTVKQAAQLVDGFFKKAVGLKGIAETGDGGVNVGHAGLPWPPCSRR